MTCVNALEASLNPKQKQGIKFLDFIWILEKWPHCTSKSKINFTRSIKVMYKAGNTFSFMNAYFDSLKVIVLIYLQN